MNKPKPRGFALSPTAAALVGDAKVGTAGDDPVVPPKGGETSATPPAATPETPPAPPAVTPAETPAEPAKPAPTPAEPAAHVHKRATDPAPDAPAPKRKPWENPTDTPKGLNFQPPADLHAKMNWVCDNVPKMSRLRILREGAMMLCDALIAKHYKEEAE
jgi:hypothetical protein